MKNKKMRESDLEQSIVHSLLLRSSLLTDIGLFHGKMGLVISFMHYYKLTDRVLYEDVAEELINEIEEGLHNNLPITFDSGLSGIGWGLDYLIRKNIVEGNSKEVCEEIDNKIMQTDPRRMTDYSLNKGIGGVLLYVLDHCKIVMEQCNMMPFDNCYLGDLHAACMKLRLLKDIPEETVRLADIYSAYYSGKESIPNEIRDVFKFVQGIPDLDERKLSDYSLGFHNGLAGVLFEKCYTKV